MPGTMTEKENLLSLVSIEILISQVRINLDLECHLPCIVFRLLDYPAVSISYFDQWQIEEFHQLKTKHRNLSWKQCLSDQFYELRSANGHFKFNRGKSCLFKTYFTTLHHHLLNVPLFLLLIDQINDPSSSSDGNTTHFIGSGNVKLDELIEILNQSIVKHGHDVPLVEQQTFHCTLFNLMGTSIGYCDVAVRFCHYGTTILTQLPMLDENFTAKPNELQSAKKINDIAKEQPIHSARPTDTVIVKNIQIVNEKRDIGLQLSRSDLPIDSNNSKSVQTRWTSTRHRSSGTRPMKGPHLSPREDSTNDDPTMTFYQPPALYFNSESDFLQQMPPMITKVVEENKKNRLSYLASIPISSFDEDIRVHRLPNRQSNTIISKKKLSPTVRFNLSSSNSSSSRSPPSPLPRTKITTTTSKKPEHIKNTILEANFLSNFPLLRALVEEALALQAQPAARTKPVADENFIERTRPKSMNEEHRSDSNTSLASKKTHRARSKSVILTRHRVPSRRLYPPASTKDQMTVTKKEVRDLVDRLSKPRPTKTVSFELEQLQQNFLNIEPISNIPRSARKSSPQQVSVKVQKPIVSYAENRAHRLLAEYSRKRREEFESRPKTPVHLAPKHSPRKETVPAARISSTSPVSLLTKVDIDSTAAEKIPTQQPSLDTIPANTISSIKLASTVSQDTPMKLNQTIVKTFSSTPEKDLPESNQELDEKQQDLNFSITDITDYFTDGAESAAQPTDL